MIKLTIGCSNSGKSTWAHEQWKENPQSTVVINRDKIRELLFSYTEDSVSEYYSRPDLSKLEKQVTKYEDTLIYEALCEGKTVIVDATHLEQKYIKRFEYWNAPLELVWFDITLKEALTRNMDRRRQVDEQIIIKQYDKYVTLRKNFSSYSFTPKIFEQDSTFPKCILVDIDGTLAHMGDRRSPYDWHKVGLDYVDTSIKRLSNSILLNHTAEVFICTGRDGICLDETQKWLEDNNIHCHKIFIRKAGDMRADWIVKEEMWEQIAKHNYIDFLVDDRMQVVRRARALGLKVLQVDYNNF